MDEYVKSINYMFSQSYFSTTPEMKPNKFHTIVSHKTDLIYHVDEVHCHRNLVSSLMVQVTPSPNDPRKICCSASGISICL
jgi:hypothetical protein